MEQSKSPGAAENAEDENPIFRRDRLKNGVFIHLGTSQHYVTILASEDRSKELHPPRRSVRRQLKQEPRPAEKKAHIHKKKEPER